MSDVYCSCVAGRRVPDAPCGEILCKREPLPDVLLTISGDTAQAEGCWCNMWWRIRAEVEPGQFARGQVWVKQPGSVDKMVADVTVHPPLGSTITDETQSVLAAILWSRLRRGWVEM